MQSYKELLRRLHWVSIEQIPYIELIIMPFGSIGIICMPFSSSHNKTTKILKYHYHVSPLPHLTSNEALTRDQIVNVKASQVW